MSIGDELGAFAVRGDTALTIGVFDGVHRGHTHLISQLIGEAASKGLTAGVVTFREHPAAVLSPSFQAQYLTSFEDRLDLLGQTAIDFAVPITFDRALAESDGRGVHLTASRALEDGELGRRPRFRHGPQT